jgi:Tol biopolymer transport system component
MRGRVLLVVLAAFVLTPVAFGGGAGQRQPSTLAVIRGPVGTFAQSRRYLAWLTPGTGPYTHPACVVQLTLLNPGTGRRMSVRGKATDDLSVCGQPADAMALAGRRAYWQMGAFSNLSSYEDLVTDAPGETRARDVAFQSIDRSSNADSIVPVSSDGSSVYAVSSPFDGTPGPIRRWTGLRSHPATSTITYLTALGAGGGRFAYALNVADCTNAPAWSANGEIAFSRGVGASTDCPGGVWGMNADGSNLRQIAAVGANPAWSPDGTKLAYDDGTNLIVANADGSSPHTVLPGKDPAWSPDGSRLAFDHAGALYVVNADGSGLHQIAATGLDPSWSPDGTQIVFARPLGPSKGLGVVNADGTGNRSLTTGNDTDPAWSPAGKRIAYVNSAILGPQIRVVAPDGTGQRTVEDPQNSNSFDSYSAPAWAPDSQHLVFVAEDDPIGDAHLVSAPVGSNKLLTLTKPPPQRFVVLNSHNGATVGRFEPSGRVSALAVSASTLAALIIDHSGARFEIFLPHPRTVALKSPPSLGLARLSASGSTIVYHVGKAIYALDARHGTPHLIAHAASRPIGLSIVGHRVAWAESSRHSSRIRAITLP